MARLERDGVGIHFEVHGSGPALLLSHGYGATSRMWQPQVAALARSRQLILWDMRGHGDSDSPEDPEAYSEEATVADMGALLDELGLERAVIGGLSLGGFMSLAFHLAHPQRVDALLLFDTGPGYKRDAPREEWNEMARGRARDLETSDLATLDASAEFVPSAHRSARGLAQAARGMLTQRDSRVIDSLSGIGVPTLVLVGAEDRPFLAAADYMARKIPGAEKVVIDGAGHAANIDRPEAFNRAVLDFLG